MSPPLSLHLNVSFAEVHHSHAGDDHGRGRSHRQTSGDRKSRQAALDQVDCADCLVFDVGEIHVGVPFDHRPLRGAKINFS